MQVLVYNLASYQDLRRLCKLLAHLGKCFLGARLLGLLFKSPRMRDGALLSTLLRLPIEFVGATELRDPSPSYRRQIRRFRYSVDRTTGALRLPQ